MKSIEIIFCAIARLSALCALMATLTTSCMEQQQQPEYPQLQLSIPKPKPTPLPLINGTITLLDKDEVGIGFGNRAAYDLLDALNIPTQPGCPLIPVIFSEHIQFPQLLQNSHPFDITQTNTILFPVHRLDSTTITLPTFNRTHNVTLTFTQHNQLTRLIQKFGQAPTTALIYITNDEIINTINATELSYNLDEAISEEEMYEKIIGTCVEQIHEVNSYLADKKIVATSPADQAIATLCPHSCILSVKNNNAQHGSNGFRNSDQRGLTLRSATENRNIVALLKNREATGR